MNLNLPLSLYYETCDEEGMVNAYFTGDIIDSEGRIICRADSEGRALDLVGGFDDLTANIEALLARHNALVEAVAWERECGTVSFTDLWLDEWNRTEDQSKSAMQELRFTSCAARADVDRLIGEGEG